MDIDKNIGGFLYFKSSYGEYRLLTKCVYEECHIYIKEFLDDHNFKSYYTRIWIKDDWVWFDVGSHSEFFIWTIEEITEDDK